MKKFIIVLVTIVLVASLAIVGCAAPEAPPEEVAPPVAPPEEVAPSVAPPEEVAPPEVAPPAAPIPAPTASDRPAAGHPGNPYEGLAVKPDGTPYRFAILPCIQIAPWLTFSSGIIESYVRRAGGEAVVLDSEMDLMRQVGIIDDIIASGEFDGVFLNPIDPHGMVSAIRRLKAAGIACVCYGDEDPSRTAVSSIHDYVKLGEIAGEYFAQVAEERGEKLIVYEVMGNIDHLSAQQRHLGLGNILEPHPLCEVYTSAACYWADSLATEAVVAAFGAHPELNAVYDMGNMAGGVLSALATVGRLHPLDHPEHVVFIATDAHPAPMEAFPEGHIDLIIGHSPWDEADVAVKAMFTGLILGKPVNKLYEGRNYYVRGEWIDYPLIWGNAMNAGTPYDELPVLDQSDIIATPYKGMP